MNTPKMTKFTTGVVLWFIGFTLPLCAQTMVTVTGTIRSASGSFGFVTTGTPFTATWTFDAGSADTDPDTTRGYYTQSIYKTATFVVGSYSWQTTGAGALTVFNNHSTSGDGIRFEYGLGGNTQNGATVGFINMDPASAGTSLFSSDALVDFVTGSSFPPSAFSGVTLLSPTFNGQLNGSVATFAISSIPEPATTSVILGMLALGSVVVWRRGRINVRINGVSPLSLW